MFGIGFWEIVVIGLVGLIVIHPKDLPEFFRRVGAAYRELMGINRKARAYYDDFRHQLADPPKSGSGTARAGDGSAGRGKQESAKGDVHDDVPGRQ